MANRDVVVRVKGDISAFKSAMSDAGKAAQDAGRQIGKAGDGSAKAFDQAGQSASSASDSMRDAGKASASVDQSAPTNAVSGWDKLASSVDNNRDSMQTAGTAMTVLGGAVVGVGAAALNTGIQYNTLQQTTRAALTTITGSAESANAQMDKLNEFASTSPFAKDVFIRAQQQLLAFGMEADKVLPTLDAIQNAVAATGGSSAQIGEISNVLAKVQSSGKMTAQTLNELGIRGIDAANIIGEQMGKSGDEIRSGITKGTLGADEALDALTKGMASKFDGAAAGVKNTFAGAMDRIKAAWRDLSADLAEPLVGTEGGGLAVTGLNLLADAMRQFQGMPDPFKNMVTSLAGLGGVATLAGGAFLLLAPRVVDTISAAKNLATAFPKTTTALGKLGKAAGIATIALIGMQALGAIFSREHTKSAEDYAQAITKVAQAGKDASNADLDSLFQGFDTFMGADRVKGVDDLASAVGKLANPSFGDGLNKNLNFMNGWMNLPDDKLTILEGRMRDMGSALGEMASSGNAEGAAQSFKLVADAFEYAGGSAQDALDLMPAYTDALKNQATAAGVAVEPNELLKWAITGIAPEAVTAAEGLKATSDAADGVGGSTEESAEATKALEKGLADIGVSAEGAVVSMERFIDVLFDAGLASMSSKEAAFGWAESLRDLRGDIKEVTDSQGKLGPALTKGMDDFNKKTDSGKAALELFNGTIRDGIDVAQTFAEDSSKSQSDVQTQLESTYSAAVKTAEGFGIGKVAAEELAREAMGIPPNVDIEKWMSNEARERAQALTGVLDEIPEFKELTVIADDKGTVMYTKEQMESITDRTVAVEATDDGTILTIQGGIDNVKGKTERLLVTDDGTVSVIKDKIENIPDYKGVKIIATDAGTVSVTKEQIQSIKDRTIKTQVTDSGTISTVQGGINNIEGSTEQIIVTDKGTAHTVQSRINAVTGKTEYVYVDDNGTTQVVQGKISGVKDGSATVHVSDGGSISWIQTAINQIHGTNVAVNIKKNLYQTKFIDTVDLSKADGGKLPRNATGSRLPTTGPGTDTVDGILGAKRDGTPVSWLDGSEWVVNNQSSDAYDNALRMINDDDPRVHNLKGLATGGRAGLGGLAKGGKAKTAAKAAAKAAAERAKEARKLAAERRKEAAEKRQRKYVDRRDYRQDARRGNVSGDMGTVDKLFALGRNADYSKSARKSAGRMAGTMEKHIVSLEKKSESLATALETATKRRDELLSVKEGVASGLRGEFSLSGVLDSTRQDLGAGMSVRSITGAANKRARTIEIFAGRLNRLRKMGYSEAIIQEVAGLGSDEGIQVAGVLMNASGKEKKSLNRAYGRMDKAADQAGQYVTESMFKGGLNAADGLVRGVEQKQAGVERAFYNLGKRAEGAFKKSLGIRSPSKVMEAAGVNVGEGAELGVLSKVSDVQKAMGQLGTTPGMGSWGTPTVPPSREVAAYAAGAGIDYDMLASAIVDAGSTRPVQTSLVIDGHKFAKAVGSAQSTATRGNPKSPFLA